MRLEKNKKKNIPVWHDVIDSLNLPSLLYFGAHCCLHSFYGKVFSAIQLTNKFN